MKTPKNKTAVAQSENGYLLRLFDFFETYLPNFPNQNFPVKKNVNEDTISVSLRRYLRSVATGENQDFDFEPQTPQNAEEKQREKRIDMGVNLFVKDRSPNTIFCIEAKRLPTPLPKDRLPQEYLYGRIDKNEGGIERFKRCFHGKNWQGNLLPQNGMFGYIEKYDFRYWHKQLNKWIEGISDSSVDWSKSETLQLIYDSKIAKLVSNHQRTGRNEQVTLTHYWISI